MALCGNLKTSVGANPPQGQHARVLCAAKVRKHADEFRVVVPNDLTSDVRVFQVEDPLSLLASLEFNSACWIALVYSRRWADGSRARVESSQCLSLGWEQVEVAELAMHSHTSFEPSQEFNKQCDVSFEGIVISANRRWRELGHKVSRTFLCRRFVAESRPPEPALGLALASF